VTTVSSVTSLVSAAGSTTAQTATGGSGISFTWVILLILILFWVFMIVQSRRRKQQQLQQRAGMEPGTRVMLTSGILGTLVERTPDTMVVEVADGVQLTVVPGAIARTLPTLDPTVDADEDDALREDADAGAPTYTDTTTASDRDASSHDRVLDLDPTDSSTTGGREPGPGESAVHEGR
jgi:preprotein translocase subunit YajC